MYVYDLESNVSTDQVDKEFAGQLELGLVHNYEIRFFVPGGGKEDCVASRGFKIPGPVLLRNPYAHTLLHNHLIACAREMMTAIDSEDREPPHPKLFESYLEITTVYDKCVMRWNGICFVKLNAKKISTTTLFKTYQPLPGQDGVSSAPYLVEVYKNAHLGLLTSADNVKAALEDAAYLGMDVSTITHASVFSDLMNGCLCERAPIESFSKVYDPTRPKYKSIKEEVVGQKTECDVQEALGLNEHPQYFIRLKSINSTGRDSWDGVISAESMKEAVALAKKVAIYEAGFRGLMSKVSFVVSKQNNSTDWKYETGGDSKRRHLRGRY